MLRNLYIYKRYLTSYYTTIKNSFLVEAINSSINIYKNKIDNKFIYSIIKVNLKDFISLKGILNITRKFL